MFQGFLFNLANHNLESPTSLDSRLPMEVNDCKNLVDFLNKMHNEGVLKETNSGLVVCADDQYANQCAMEMHFKDLKLTDKLLFFSNG